MPKGVLEAPYDIGQSLNKQDVHVLAGTEFGYFTQSKKGLTGEGCTPARSKQRGSMRIHAVRCGGGGKRFVCNCGECKGCILD